MVLSVAAPEMTSRIGVAMFGNDLAAPDFTGFYSAVFPRMLEALELLASDDLPPIPISKGPS